jgi:hypothetical protein
MLNTLPVITGFTDSDYYALAAGVFPGADPGQSFSAFVLAEVPMRSADNFLFGNLDVGTPAGWGLSTTTAQAVSLVIANETVTVPITAVGGGGWLWCLASFDGTVGAHGSVRLMVNGVLNAAGAGADVAANPTGIASVGSGNPNTTGIAALSGGIAAFGYVQQALSYEEMGALWQKSYRAGGVPLVPDLSVLSASFKGYRVPFSNQGTLSGGVLVPSASWLPYAGGTTPVATRTGSALVVEGRTLPF